MPVIRAQELVSTLIVGDLVALFATDPGVMYDLPAWCRVHGHELVTCAEDGDEYIVEFRVGGR